MKQKIDKLHQRSHVIQWFNHDFIIIIVVVIVVIIIIIIIVVVIIIIIIIIISYISFLLEYIAQ